MAASGTLKSGCRYILPFLLLVCAAFTFGSYMWYPRPTLATALSTPPIAVSPDEASLDDSVVILHAVANTIGTLGNKWQSQALGDISKELRQLVQELEVSDKPALAKRGFFGSLFGGGAGGSSSADSASAASSNPLVSGFMSIISKAGGGILSSLEGDLVGPAGALGDGLSGGAVKGLQIAKTGTAAPPQATYTGVSAIAESLGSGLSNSLFSKANLSSLMPGTGDINSAAKSLAVGLGNGTASGLALSKAQLAPPADASGVAGIAGSLGFGLTSSLFSNIDTSSLLASGQASGVMSKIMGAIGPAAVGLGTGAAEGLGLSKSATPSTALAARDAATTTANTTSSSLDVNALAKEFTLNLASSFLGNVNTSNLATPEQQAAVMSKAVAAIGPAGRGLGSGAAQGLGLSKAVAAPAASMTNGSVDVPAAAEDFTQNLSSSFLGSVNVSMLTQMASSGVMSQMIGPAAMGIGKGLGEGTAIGLKLQTDTNSAPSNSSDVAGITETFSKSLTSSFLGGDTLANLQTKLTTLTANMSVTSSINVQQVGQGFAKGLVQGAGDAFRGNSAADTQVMAFNDSVSGAATGFGLGLGGQGASIAMGLLMKNAPTQSTVSKRAYTAEMVSSRRLISSRDVAVTNTTNTTNTTDTTNTDLTTALSDIGSMFSVSNLNVTKIDAIAQKGLNALTCEGVGGLASIGLGLVSSGTIDLASFKSSNLSFLGNTTFEVTNAGNIYRIMPSTRSLTLNGVEIGPFVILMAVHSMYNNPPDVGSINFFIVTVAIIAYFVLVPIVVILASAQDITRIIGRPDALKKAPRWSFIAQFFLALPLAVATVVTGILVIGQGSHFRTVHEVRSLDHHFSAQFLTNLL
jgi:hypothetical protein